MTGEICLSNGCEKLAKLQCPTCIKLAIEGSFFCSQDCFKCSWDSHKDVHKKKRQCLPYDPWPNFHYTGTLRPYRQSERRKVPEAIKRPDYALHPDGRSLEEEAARSSAIKVLDDEEIEGLKVVCKLAREVLNEAGAAVGPGVTTDEIDRVTHEAALERDCYPSPLGYYGFPKSVCTSVNEVICHGIPDMRPLEDGDICNIDVTVYHRGFHGDLNETFLVGDVDDETVRLVKTTHECLQEAIKLVKPGTKFRDLGNAIQKHANAAGYSVVRTFCGHGIHRLFHTAPNVPHYAMPWYELAAHHAISWLLWEENKAVGVMKAGNSFTIEPMINAGSYHDERWPDDWTATTRDGKRSAQFEQTMIVTDTGVEVLTAREGGRPHFMDQLAAKGKL